MEFDHILFAATDLDAAARELETRYGLSSIEGARHAGWGTANRIVPLGETYLELVTVVDETEAGRSTFGRWIEGALPSLARPLGWAVRTNRLDNVAERLGLEVSDGSRHAPDGRALRWRVAGVEQASAEPCLPFFIEWGSDTTLPGRAAVSRAAGHATVAALQLTGDRNRLDDWLGVHELPIAVSPGRPALVAVTLEGAGGEIVVADSP